MRSILTRFVAALILGIVPLRADLALQPNDVLAICGDSITEQKLYSAFMEDYFLMCQPVEGMRTVQFGWAGERAAGFLTRLDSDILPLKPTIATICYGMNDGGYSPMVPSTGDAYRQALTASVKKLKAGGVRAIVVGSPGCVDAAAFVRSISAEEYNKTLDALRGIAQEVARNEGVAYADVYSPMKEVMSKSKAAYGDKYPFIAGGGVHPGSNGHLVMAYAFLKALGCDGTIGTITVDLGSDKAEGTPGQRIVSCHDGAVTVESTRYPFCFQGDPDKPEQTTASVMKFFPFNDDLNRYLLVVNGLKGSKAKVTWGGTTKEFAAGDLAKGVNLAAEFLVNPFCNQFAKVHSAVQAQQLHETTLVKSFLHYLPAFKVMAPHSIMELDKVAADGMAQDTNLFAAASALVIPIQHTLKIEPEP